MTTLDWKMYPNIYDDLQQVKSELNNLTIDASPLLSEALNEMLTNGGKYLRPAFFLLFSQLTKDHKVSHTELIKIAASLEVLHSASLIHDDIIDDSPLRRGTITIQSKFGKDVAVYAGDLLFTKFFDLILETMQTTPYLKINAQAMQKLLQGELGQMAQRYKQQSLLSYLRNVNGKTATLFKLAAMEGAYFGGSDAKTVKRAARIGQNIGMAFQVLDDILDYTSDSATMQKPVLEDLTCGVYSLPLLLVLPGNQKLQATLQKAHLEPIDYQYIQEEVINQGGVQQAHQIAHQFTEKALADVNKLPHSKAKKQLKQLTKQLLKRTS